MTEHDDQGRVEVDCEILCPVLCEGYPWTGKVKAWLNEAHCGDCIKVPATCVRCVAEDVLKAARHCAEIDDPEKRRLEMACYGHHGSWWPNMSDAEIEREYVAAALAAADAYDAARGVVRISRDVLACIWQACEEGAFCLELDDGTEQAVEAALAGAAPSTVPSLDVEPAGSLTKSFKPNGRGNSTGFSQKRPEPLQLPDGWQGTVTPLYAHPPLPPEVTDAMVRAAHEKGKQVDLHFALRDEQLRPIIQAALTAAMGAGR